MADEAEAGLTQLSGQDLASWKCFSYICCTTGGKSWLCCTYRAHRVEKDILLEANRFEAARFQSHTGVLGVGSHTKVFDSWCGTRQISENRQQSRRGTGRRAAAIAHSLNSGTGGWRSEPISGLTRPVCKHRDRNLGNHT